MGAREETGVHNAKGADEAMILPNEVAGHTQKGPGRVLPQGDIDHLELQPELSSLRQHPGTINGGLLTMVGTVTVLFKPLRLWIPARLEECVKICRISVIVGERSTRGPVGLVHLWLSRRPKPVWALKDVPLDIPAVGVGEKLAVDIEFEAVPLSSLAMGFVGRSHSAKEVDNGS